MKLLCKAGEGDPLDGVFNYNWEQKRFVIQLPLSRVQLLDEYFKRPEFITSWGKKIPGSTTVLWSQSVFQIYLRFRRVKPKVVFLTRKRVRFGDAEVKEKVK